jgi:thioesterase domain-containing protein
MIPALYVPMDKMPLTANGKVDRGALPEPPVSSFEDSITAVPPDNRLETQIARVWEKVLGHKPVGIHDNFFDLGGDSFLAVKVVQRIEKICGKRLAIAAFFRAPTVAEMAVLLRTEDSVVWPSLVQIKEGGPKPPFFCVHGLGGGVLRYRDLARRLPPDQPVYGLQALGLDGRCACLTCLEDMAAHYIEEIRGVQPEGPYYLGGFSFGGVVAFEMARQLHQLGQEVGLVALLDSFPTNYARRSPLAKFWHLSDQQKMSYVLDRVKYLRNRIVGRISNHFLPPTVKQVQKACRVAAQRYVPKVYPGRVLLFRASDRTLCSRDDLFLGWNDLALGGAEVHEIQGDHLSIVDEPAVRKLATDLALCLDRAAAPHKASIFPAEDMSITRVHC